MPLNSIRKWRITPTLEVSAPSDSIVGSALDTVYSETLFTPTKQDPEAIYQAHFATDDPLEQGPYRLTINGCAWRVVDSWRELAPALETAIVNLAVQTRLRKLVFHTAAFGMGSRSGLLIGESGSGKSSLSLWLALHGARYYGDELLFLDLEARRWEAFPKSITLKKGTASAYGRTDFFFSKRRKELCYHVAENSARGAERLPPVEWIFVPQYSPGESTSVAFLEPHETLLMLAQQCLGGLHHHPLAFESVMKVVAQRACVIRFSSLEEAGAVLCDCMSSEGRHE